MAPAVGKVSLEICAMGRMMRIGTIKISKIGLLGTVVFASIMASHETQAQTAITPSPKDFVSAVAQSDQYEILAANIAKVQSQDPRVVAFAQEMVQDHTRLSVELHQAAMASGLPAPGSGMSSDQASLLGSLQSVRGTEFDKTYARQQALAHAQAVAVEESFATAGSDPNLRKSAQSELPTIQHHLQMARQLLVDVSGP